MSKRTAVVALIAAGAALLTLPSAMAQNKEFRNAVERLNYKAIWPPSNQYSLGGTYRPKDLQPMKTGCYAGDTVPAAPGLDRISIELNKNDTIAAALATFLPVKFDFSKVGTVTVEFVGLKDQALTNVRPTFADQCLGENYVPTKYPVTGSLLQATSVTIQFESKMNTKVEVNKGAEVAVNGVKAEGTVAVERGAKVTGKTIQPTYIGVRPLTVRLIQDSDTIKVSQSKPDGESSKLGYRVLFQKANGSAGAMTAALRITNTKIVPPFTKDLTNFKRGDVVKLATGFNRYDYLEVLQMSENEVKVRVGKHVIEPERGVPIPATPTGK